MTVCVCFLCRSVTRAWSLIVLVIVVGLLLFDYLANLIIYCVLDYEFCVRLFYFLKNNLIIFSHVNLGGFAM